jgi:sulfite reductase (NADPH) flavoprotein alpha-component
MTASEFRGPGLSEAQWQQIKALATSLDSAQLAWVSGYFAGFEQGARGRPAAAVAEDRPAVGRTVTVLYGSETGNSAALAATVADQAKARGLNAVAQDMATYRTRQLKDERDLIVITSTYGEGDPPQPAVGFFEFIEGRKAPKLPDVRFAVLGLGDSTYERYCEAGKRLDRRLEELGASRLCPRVDCDIDYDGAAAAWTSRVLEALGGGGNRDAVARPAASVRAVAAPAVVDKRHPFAARVIENIVLTGRGSSKETRHVELSIDGAALGFEPGDALGVLPDNDPVLVSRILETIGLAHEAPIEIGGERLALGDALRSRLEITALTPRFLELWSKLADSETLRLLARPASAADRAVYARANQVVDVMRLFPVRGIAAQDLAAGLRPLQPRLYSIASSLASAPDEAHLTVATVRFALHGEQRSGVASGHFADRAAVDALVPVYVQKSPHFRLPEDDVPIVMIGAGTGVAPYRAFMQEREARGAPGRSWLFFGERNFRTDFLYQSEWQAMLKSGVLTRLDVAFSRDRRADGDTKTYVQHRMRERSRDIFAWLEEGAHIYVCGDAARLAPDVHAALQQIVTVEGGLGAAASEDYLGQLQRDGRYQHDVY